jgi:thiamine-phosphate pyrophosphorylase
MTRRQTMPRQWLILDAAVGVASMEVLQRGNGVIIIGRPGAAQVRRIRAMARAHGLTVAFEARGDAARVHNLRELRNALLRDVPLILLSPIFPTRSHPEWRPIPRMRAAALARLANRRLLALGGMDAKRYATIAPLGFIGWAGISAFRT